jgi:protein tyrosine phosphatase (PTP) superfamily phosphohydrolase (DUF442 family)
MEQYDTGLNGIYNFLMLSDDLATAGQPSEEELRAVAQCGFDVVINLGLSDTEYALADERGLVTSIGMVYEHIPVEWERPSAKALSTFCQTIRRWQHKKVFLHCAANKRVSVFLALYRIICLKWPEQQALQDIRRIWEPSPTWQEFFDNHKRGGFLR